MHNEKTNYPLGKASNGEWDGQLQAMIERPIPMKQERGYDRLLNLKVKAPLAGMYIKKPNQHDIKNAAPVSIKNVFWLFLHWQQWPVRIFRHQGFQTKFYHVQAVRACSPQEVAQINASFRLNRVAFYNWNAAAEYHLRQGFDIGFIETLSKAYVLDGQPFDKQTVTQASFLPVESTFRHNQGVGHTLSLKF